MEIMKITYNESNNKTMYFIPSNDIVKKSLIKTIDKLQEHLGGLLYQDYENNCNLDIKELEKLANMFYSNNIYVSDDIVKSFTDIYETLNTIDKNNLLDKDGIATYLHNALEYLFN